MYGYDLDKWRMKDYDEEINRLKTQLISDPLAFNKIDYLTLERDKHITESDKHVKKREKKSNKRYRIITLIIMILGVYLTYLIFLQGK